MSASARNLPRMSRVVRYILLLLAIVSLCAVTHEAGHVLTAVAFGQPPHRAGVFPGFQVYPTVEWIGWNRLGAWVSYDAPLKEPQMGLRMLMGSGLNALLAYVGLLIAAFSRPRLRVVLLGGSLLFAWDMFLYATMPLLGLRHGITIGGPIAEPVVAAKLMHVPAYVFWFLLAAHFVLFHSLLCWIWFRKRDARVAAI